MFYIKLLIFLMVSMVQSVDRTVILGLSATTVTIAPSDPTPVSLDWQILSGVLMDDVTNLPIGAAAVDILINGITEATVTTDSEGAYAMDAQFEEGHYSLQAIFRGDAGHAYDASTLAFVDAWRPTTSITIAVSPGSGAPPLEETISGKLTRDDTGAGIQVPIKLFKDDVEIDSKFAGVGGSYSFTDSLPDTGVFVYYTKFEGNLKFQGCEGVILPCLECRRPVDIRGKDEATCRFCDAVFEVVPILG